MKSAVQGHGGACVCAPPSDKVNVRPNIPTTRCGRHPPSSTARTRRKYLRFRPWNVAAYSPSWAPRSLSGPKICHALSAAGVRTNLRRSRNSRGMLCSRRSHWRGSGQTPLAGCVCQSSRPRLASPRLASRNRSLAPPCIALNAQLSRRRASAMHLATTQAPVDDPRVQPCSGSHTQPESEPSFEALLIATETSHPIGVALSSAGAAARASAHDE